MFSMSTKALWISLQRDQQPSQKPGRTQNCSASLLPVVGAKPVEGCVELDHVGSEQDVVSNLKTKQEQFTCSSTGWHQKCNNSKPLTRFQFGLVSPSSGSANAHLEVSRRDQVGAEQRPGQEPRADDDVLRLVEQRQRGRALPLAALHR